MKTLVQNNTAFAIDLFRQLGKDGKNLFFSPYSLSSALAMTFAGARGNTKTQMAKALRFSREDSRLHEAFAQINAKIEEVKEKFGIELAVANALWPQKDYPFLEEYLTLVAKYHHARITPLDYARSSEASRQTINTWVEEKTCGKIRNLIPRKVLRSDTSLVLTNAVYFKGNWATSFDSSLTEKSLFFPTPGKRVPVPMMNLRQLFGYGDLGPARILDLPYSGNGMSMWVILPKKADGLAELEKNLSPRFLEELTIRMSLTELDVFLPKFKMDSQFKLDETLKHLGMEDAFTQKADFSGMTGTRDLFISAALHKAFVSVDEKGTEAAAASAVLMTRGMPTGPPPEFRVDHPFLFLIRENRTGSILFMGRVTDPSVAA